MKNIVFSTTRQWNPGDEFILFGVLNLLKELDINFNPIIFNRNPEIRQNGKKRNVFKKFQYDFAKKPKFNKFYEQIETFFRIGQWDNSFKDHYNYKYIDLVIFAGSPEWQTPRCRSLYQFILKNKIPTLFLGIGNAGDLHSSSFSQEILKTLNDALLITVRDRSLHDILLTSSVGNSLVPCPALFSCPMNHEKKIDSVKKVGLVFASNRSVTNQSINKLTETYIISLFKKLVSQYSNFDFSLVCHYIDEIEHCKEEFPEQKVYYSYDAKDYLSIYSKFDAVVTPRVHGAGISSSLGIPSLTIAHDLRGDTCKGFLSKIVLNNSPLDATIELFDEIINNVQSINNELINHKREILKNYQELIQDNVLEVLAWKN